MIIVIIIIMKFVSPKRRMDACMDGWTQALLLLNAHRFKDSSLYYMHAFPFNNALIIITIIIVVIVIIAIIIVITIIITLLVVVTIIIIIIIIIIRIIRGVIVIIIYNLPHSICVCPSSTWFALSTSNCLNTMPGSLGGKKRKKKGKGKRGMLICFHVIHIHV